MGWISSMCRRKTYSYSFDHAISQLTTLSDFQKLLITNRYILLLAEYERRCFLLSIYFHTSHIIVTVGSLIVPALLSIQYTDTSSGSSNPSWDSQEFSYQIYWGTWVISLLVTIANGILALLKIDKKYYFLHTTLEHLRSEGWQYLELSGRYSGFFTPHENPTHTNQFIYFCHVIEKIKMKQVEEEYYKLNESQAPTTGATARAPLPQDTQVTIPQNTGQVETRPANTVIQPTSLVSDGLIPPTPLNPLLLKLLNPITGEKVSKVEIGGDAPTEISNTVFTNQHDGDKHSEVSKVSVRPAMSEQTDGKKLILRSTSEILPTSESNDRMGAEISAIKVEQESKSTKNA